MIALVGTRVGRSPVAWASGSMTAGSPDGSRIAVVACASRCQSEVGDYPGVALLYMLTPYGSDVQVQVDPTAKVECRQLARIRWRADLWRPEHFCRSNVRRHWVHSAVPDSRPGLVRDCQVMVGLQPQYTRPGMN